jgi:UDP-2-acetamido-2-deoxy-ribo-hexuluronate aminotransferase
MQQIKMVDLGGQHSRIQNELDEAINKVMKATAFIKGPDVKLFEEELASYLNCKHVIGCANGTDALQLALMALELPAGSEVITTDFTFVATAEVVRLLGLTPVLVDIEPGTFNIDIQKLEAAITPKTKVIIPVHLFGQCADMESIMNIASQHNLYVVEDTAQAIGATYTFKNGSAKKAGTIGHIGCTSFFPSKNLGGAGDGGAVFTSDDTLAKKIGSIANHGMRDQYYYDYIGINSRLDTLQAAILRVKLRHLDEYNKARQNAAAAYDAAFSRNEMLAIPKRNTDSTHIFHQYTLKVLNGKRDALAMYLNEKNVPNKVYYPVPIHANPPYMNSCRFDIAKLENTLKVTDEVISLPMHTELDEEQLKYITSAVNGFFDR